MRRLDYRSRFVIESPSAAIGFAKSFVRFTAIVMLPIMILIFVAALQGEYLTPYLYSGFIGGLALATIVTQYWMRTTPAFLSIHGSSAAVLSVSEFYTLGDSESNHRHAYVLDVRKTPEMLSITVGLDSFRLKRTDWMNFDEVSEVLAELNKEYHHL